MSYLIDTSILLRLANSNDTLLPVAQHAVERLHLDGETLCIAPQILIEFRSASTRPLKENGLGLSHADAETKAAKFETAFRLLPENPDIFPAWKAIVHAGNVIGKQVHDVRIAAVCNVHGVTHILTFNISHFVRLAALVGNLIAVDPSSL